MTKKTGSVLIVEDDQDVLYTARLVLKKKFETVQAITSPHLIPELMEKDHYDVILLDMNFQLGATSGQEGLDWLRKILQLEPEAHVIMNTAYGDIKLAVDAMKLGAIDFIVKPWEQEKLLATIGAVYELSQQKKKVKLLESRQAFLSADLDGHFGEIISQSSLMDRVFQTVKKVAATDASVLILGENGTGKELIAREIHRRSLRREEALIKVDLGSIPESLFESELFGHKKGAFTDAKENRKGRFEAASGGTLFLDEVGNTPLPQQAKLLNAIQHKQVTPVGANLPVNIEVRLICATNNNLYQMVDQHHFRQDLLYRINTVEIVLPPLRERVGDIALLARHFMKLYGKKYQKNGLKLDKKSLRQLESHSWPGNIRELQHTIERAVILANGDHLLIDDLKGSNERNADKTRQETLNRNDMEKALIAQAIAKHQGNLSKAAETLGMGRSTLYRKITKYGL